MADISEEERARLPPFLSTVEDAHRPGEYVVMLSVFHQLHCLVNTFNYDIKCSLVDQLCRK